MSFSSVPAFIVLILHVSDWLPVRSGGNCSSVTYKVQTRTRLASQTEARSWTWLFIMKHRLKSIFSQNRPFRLLKDFIDFGSPNAKRWIKSMEGLVSLSLRCFSDMRHKTFCSLIAIKLSYEPARCCYLKENPLSYKE